MIRHSLPVVHFSVDIGITGIVVYSFSPAGNLVIDMGSDFVDGASCATDQRGLPHPRNSLGHQVPNIFWQPKGGCSRRLCRLIRHSHWKHPHFNAFAPPLPFLLLRCSSTCDEMVFSSSLCFRIIYVSFESVVFTHGNVIEFS